MAITTVIVRDAGQKTFGMYRVDEAGVLVEADEKGSIILQLGLNTGGLLDGTDNQNLRIWRVHYTDTAGALKRVRGVFSSPENDDAPNPGDAGNTVHDMFIGGGSPIRKFVFQSFQTNYLVANEYGSLVLQNVALPYTMRQWGSRTLRGDLINYSSYDNPSQTRVATDPLGDELQGITEQYCVGDEIFVGTATDTGVSVDDVELHLIDLNVDGRAWAKLVPPP